MSKLRIAFEGAAQQIVKPDSLKGDAFAISAATLIGVAAGSALLPALALASASCVVYDGIKGAYKALKNG